MKKNYNLTNLYIFHASHATAPMSTTHPRLIMNLCSLLSSFSTSTVSTILLYIILSRVS